MWVGIIKLKKLRQYYWFNCLPPHKTYAAISHPSSPSSPFFIGNCCVIKPSELSEATAALMEDLIPKYMDNVGLVFYPPSLTIIKLSKTFMLISTLFLCVFPFKWDKEQKGQHKITLMWYILMVFFVFVGRSI